MFVQLECDREELVVRVQSESRKRHEKLTDPQVLLDRYAGSATMPFTPHLRLDTTHVPPTEAASRVAAYYSLALAEPSTPMVAFRANPSAVRWLRA